VRAPATRDQADAYRFGVRRLEAALVRGDPVPLNEHIRTQRRSALAGVALGMLSLCAAVLIARFGSSPAGPADPTAPAGAQEAAADWRGRSVVAAPGSADLFAVVGGPERLVPVADLSAARLVLAASGRTDAATATPVAVAATALQTASVSPTVAVAGADGAPPGGTVAGTWALCDEVDGDGVLTGTTVVGGAAPLPPAAPEDGVLVADPDENTWLVTGGRRHRVDTGDGALLAAYGLARVVPRAVDPDLLALLPQGPRLATPDVPDRGDPAPAGLPGRIGDVLVSRPAGGGAGYFVVLSRGLQPVPDVVADLLRVASGARTAREVDPAVVAGARIRHDLDVSGWPDPGARLQDPAAAPVLCWTWTATGGPSGQVWTGPALPPGSSAPATLAGTDGPGPALDRAAVGPGGAVRAVAAEDTPAEPAPRTAGTPDRAVTGHNLRAAVAPASDLRLVAPGGTSHPVADDATATALGIIADPAPAPAQLLDLLPAGPPLDLDAATGAVRAVLR
jgi:type VII secretion protein EccB